MITKKDRELVKEIQEKFQKASTYWTKNRKGWLSDLKFFTGIQYDEAASRAQRARGSAPQIVNNLLPGIVQDQENELRSMNVAINIHPTDKKGSDETAEVVEGLVRSIEHDSTSQEVYLAAAGKMHLITGIGWGEISTEYVGDSFDQKIVMLPVKDAMKILPDPSAIKPDSSDMNYMFKLEELSSDEYLDKYAKSDLTREIIDKVGESNPGKIWDLVGTKMKGTDWCTDSAIRIVRYYYKTVEEHKKVMFEDGSITEKYVAADHPQEIVGYEEIPENERDPENPNHDMIDSGETNKDGTPVLTAPQRPVMKPMKIKAQRIINEVTVKWADCNGFEILLDGECQTQTIPFRSCIHTDMIVDGERIIHGMVRNSKDAQKMYNYMSSQFVRKIAASNRAPWLAAIESIPDSQRPAWESANTADPSVLYYRAYNDGGKQLPPPLRGDTTEPAVQALLAGKQQFQNDIKATAGIPQNTPEMTPDGTPGSMSGVGIATLAEQGQKMNAHISHGLVMFVRSFGELILDHIASVYDTPRWVRIIGADTQPEIVAINQFIEEGKHKGKIHDLKGCAGCYGVMVDTGASYATRKSQQFDKLIEFGKAFPMYAPYIASDIARNADFDASNSLADKITAVEAYLYPWLDQKGDQADWPPEAKAAFAKQQAQLTQCQQHLVTVTNEYKDLMQKMQAKVTENEGKIELEKLKGDIELKLKKMETAQDELAARTSALHDSVELQLDHAHRTRELVLGK